ncbi:MAG: CPBP family intramembrane glutamic endopeptidase [Rhodoglobus sp.]
MHRSEADSAHPASGSNTIAMAAVALIVAILLSAVLTALLNSGVVLHGYFVESLSYLVFWVPLAIAVIAIRRSGSRIRIQFRWIDLLWGLSVGLLARAISTVIELSIYGTTGSTYLSGPLGESIGATAFFVVTALVAPLVLGPVIEELFFRGTVLGALRGTTVTSGAIAVVVSSLVFALMHVLGASTPAAALANGMSTFLFAIGAGGLALTTNRLGGPIVAHIVFNGSLIALASASNDSASVVGFVL